MKIDLNFPITGLNGEPIQGKFDDTHAGAILAATLAYLPKQHPEISAMKRTIIAHELYKRNPVEVDKDELNAIREIVSWQETNYSPIIAIQILEAINKVQE